MLAGLTLARPAPGGEGANPAERFAQAADYGAAHGGRAILIRQRGAVVFERYDRGWTATRPNPLASPSASCFSASSPPATGRKGPAFPMLPARFSQPRVMG